MQTILTVVHVFLAIGVIGLILMQHGKGADAGAAFGSGSSGSVFGAQGAGNFLSRSTAILATLFFVTSIALGYFSMNAGPRVDLMKDVAVELAPQAPVAESDMPLVPAPATAASDIDVPEVPKAASTQPRSEDAAAEDGVQAKAAVSEQPQAEAATAQPAETNSAPNKPE
jgi:preprotein translocase subunit SecG